jgi:hypothetical protein
VHLPITVTQLNMNELPVGAGKHFDLHSKLANGLVGG